MPLTWKQSLRQKVAFHSNIRVFMAIIPCCHFNFINRYINRSTCHYFLRDSAIRGDLCCSIRNRLKWTDDWQVNSSLGISWPAESRTSSGDILRQMRTSRWRCLARHVSCSSSWCGVECKLAGVFPFARAGVSAGVGGGAACGWAYVCGKRSSSWRRAVISCSGRQGVVSSVRRDAQEGVGAVTAVVCKEGIGGSAACITCSGRCGG